LYSQPTAWRAVALKRTGWCWYVNANPKPVTGQQAAKIKIKIKIKREEKARMGGREKMGMMVFCSQPPQPPVFGLSQPRRPGKEYQ
jgi:hypothetical protein